MAAARLGIGVVGCGKAAADVCAAIDQIEGVSVTAAFDEIAAAAAALAGSRGARVHATLDGLLQDRAVDIAYVGLPHNLLASVSEAALRAGKHVLVEKPMALVPAEALALGRLADERKLRLCVFFELREAGTVKLARELVAGGAIGSVRRVHLRTIIDKPLSYWQPRGGPIWRASLEQAGGGVVLMNSIHQIDTMRFVTELDVVEAAGQIATLDAPAGVEVEDSAAAVLRLTGGGMATLVAAAHSAGADNEETIGIDGADGRIEIPSPFDDRPVRLFLRRTWQQNPAGEWINLPTPRPDFYVGMVRAFVDAVRTGSAPPATAQDAAGALAIVLAIYRSARERRAVIID